MNDVFRMYWRGAYNGSGYEVIENDFFFTYFLQIWANLSLQKQTKGTRSVKMRS